MESEPCNVCSGTDLKLVDGFYYCVECGTQNANVRETILEQKTLGDGTVGIGTKRKIIQLDDTTIQMSGEWYKWHAYNFILCSLADELMTLGAKPTFKTKLLWIWTRYIKKYQNTEELRSTEKPDGENNEAAHLTTFFIEEEDSNAASECNEDAVRRKCNNLISKDISIMSRGLIVSMLYLALNLDQSDLQLSHLYRFIKEKRLNVDTIEKLVPKEIPLLKIPRWKSFLCSRLHRTHELRTLMMCLLNELDLGSPIVPDLRKIVDTFLLELCLPNDLKPLIFSLMYLSPCYFLDIDKRAKQVMKRLPDYEVTVMSYILIAMKMCFGLDCNYEVNLSDIVDKINDERDLSKSHRIGKYSEPSNRLFSFRDWNNYIQYRKNMLSKHSPLMVNQHYMDVNEYVYLENLEHLNVEKRDKRKVNTELTDKISIDIISKIPYENDTCVITKELFTPSLTPMSDYTEIIIEHSQDLEKRLILSEDFTQYSLKYACEYLDLNDFSLSENVIKGVSEGGKTIKKVILGSIVTKRCKPEMVYVKNCENINWRKTNPPTIEHVVRDEIITEADKETVCDNSICVTNDKESDHGYDSDPPLGENDEGSNSNNKTNCEDLKNGSIDANLTEIDCNATKTNELNGKNKEDKIPTLIEEETLDNNIFDDLFEDFDLKDEPQQEHADDLGSYNEQQNIQMNNTINEDVDNLSDWSNTSYVPFNPETFDRERTIKECILGACKKFKIPTPAEYRIREPRRRRNENVFPDEDAPKPKRNRLKASEAKKKIEQLIGSYYNNLQSDFMHIMQREVQLAIQNTQTDEAHNRSPNSSINMDQTLGLGNTNPVISDTEILQTEEHNEVNQSVVSNNEQHINITDTNEIVDDECLEDTLFDEDGVMELDDLIPKNDPKFDAEKYDIDQLYIKIKTDPDDYKLDPFDIKDDPNLEEILLRKIEQCEVPDSTQFENLKAEANVTENKVDDIFDSEDEEVLLVMQKEKLMIENMEAYEESFKHLINKDNIPEFKYWFRHYDSTWLCKSKDLYTTFDEELKQNTPTSFYFVIHECAGVLNCSTFYLYKRMQRLEQSLIAKARNLPVGHNNSNEDDTEDPFLDEQVT